MPDLVGPKVLYLGYCGVIDPAAVHKIASGLNTAVNDQFDEVYLCISSPGGIVNDGIYLYHHIMGLPIKVTMHNTGHVGSIATTIFAAAERRIAAARSTFMIHPVGIQPNGNLGHAGLTALLELAAADEARIEAILRARSNIPEDILTRRRGTEIYFTGDEALKHGLVTEVGEFALPPGNKVFHL